jgi:hypothetical protein
MNLSALLMALALAATAETSPPVIHDVTFVPLSASEREYAALGPVGPYYPVSEIHQKGSGLSVTNGEAVLDCRVQAGGMLDACRIVSQRPVSSTFGPAAQRMALKRRIFVTDAPPGADRVLVRVPFDPKMPVTFSP